MTNQERINEIDKLLKKWAKIIEQNPNSRIGKDYIYHLLIFNGTKKEEELVDLSSEKVNTLNIFFSKNKKSTFSNWIDKFSKSNTKCFVSPDWQYFCQFISKDNKAYNSDEHIKMYVPLDAKHIERGVQMIFKFLDKNKISHLSKVGKRIRFDNVVIRLINPEDADKLLDFIKKNHYIQDGLLKPNPFAFQKDNIALAVDGDLSYNSTVSRLITDYLLREKENNNLKNVSADNFYNYVNVLYKTQFITHENDHLSNLFDWEDYEEINYREVISLILKSKNSFFQYKDLIDHYLTCANISNSEELETQEVNDMLIESIIAMTKRFNKCGTNNVEAYYETGNPTLITSQNRLRERVVNNNFRDRLRKILNKNNISFIDYAENLLQEYDIDLESFVSQNIR